MLKIPWKNLYNDKVEAYVERLFLLAVPNQEVKYDPVKEERWNQEAKLLQLKKVEEAKKREAEKGRSCRHQAALDPWTIKKCYNRGDDKPCHCLKHFERKQMGSYKK